VGIDKGGIVTGWVGLSDTLCGDPGTWGSVDASLLVDIVTVGKERNG